MIATVDIYVFKSNPFQAHSLEQSYHPNKHLKRKNIIQNKFKKIFSLLKAQISR